MYVYIDESGILTLGQGNYFIVAAYVVPEREIASRCLKKIRQQLQKRYKMRAELKHYHSSLEARHRILSCMVNEDFQVYYMAFEKTVGTCNQFSIKGEIFLTLLERIHQDYGRISEVYIDKFLKKSQEEMFSRYFSSVPIGKICYVDSQRCPGVQVADFLSGALGQHYNRPENGDTEYAIIQQKLVEVCDREENKPKNCDPSRTL